MCTFFFFSEMFALKKRARGGKTRANAKSLRTSRNRVREFLPRANQSRFFLLFARRGKSRRERLLNYARSNFFFLKRKDENFSQKNVIVTFFSRKSTLAFRKEREERDLEKNDVRPAHETNGQRRHRVLFALFQRIRVLLRGDAREEEIRFGRFGSRGEEAKRTGDD